MSKTGRIRGRTWNGIVKIAQRRKTKLITWRDVPGQTPNQATSNLYQMFKQGYFARIKVGTRGRNASPAIYKLIR